MAGYAELIFFLKQKLLNRRICTEEEAERMVNPSFFQVIGKVQKRFEHEVEAMDVSINFKQCFIVILHL